MAGDEPALPQNTPGGSEPGLQAEYALLEVILTLSDIDPTQREAAIELLLELGDDAVPALVRASIEERRDSRLAAAHAMGIVGHEAFLPELARLLRDSDAWVRTTAAKSLVAVAARHNALPDLLDAFGEEPPTPDVTDSMMWLLHDEGSLRDALINSEDLRAIPLTLRLARAADGYGYLITRQIARLGTPALPVVLRELAHLGRSGLSSHMRTLLAELGSNCADPVLRSEIAVLLWRLLRRNPWDLDQWALVEVIRRIGDAAAALDALEIARGYVYLEDYDPFIAGLIRFVGERGTPEQVEALCIWRDLEANHPLIAAAMEAAQPECPF